MAGNAHANSASNPGDVTTGSVQWQLARSKEKFNKRSFGISPKAILHPKHFSKDINASKGELKNKAAEELKPHANITQEEIQQKAKDESRTG
jgi:hypothetical protein